MKQADKSNHKNKLMGNEELKYHQYLESLTPISKEKFKKKLKKVMDRYSRFLSACKKEYLISFNESHNRFKNIILSIVNARTELDYAEIIDNLEAILNDWETSLRAIKKEIRVKEQIKHIEQLKKERARKKTLLKPIKGR
ncbi:hypothetical protein HDR59_02335 [bacterium]|nr:hypothetical protein [bacterium]